jgi:hypothetical protein
MTANGGMMKYALIGGVIAGILSGAPLVSCCCCLWFIGGGYLSAYMMGKKQALDQKKAAILGAVSGVIAGIVSTIVATVVALLFAGVVASMGLPMSGMDGSGNIASQMGFEVLGQGVLMIGRVIIGAILGAIGGIIYVETTKRKTQSAPPAPSPPQSPPAV